jgi:hypothetical protein
MEIVKFLIDKTDPIVLLVMLAGIGYILNRISLIKKDVSYINNAVNDREKGELTISQEVKAIFKKLSALTVKLEVHITELEYVKREVDAHRKIDEVTFKKLASDISRLTKKVDKI